MEKDILIQNLRTRVGEDDASVISDQTFDGIAESVLSVFADDSKITEDSWKLPVAALKNFAGQKRADEKKFTEKYKGEYETQHKTEVETKIADAVKAALDKYKQEHPENAGGSGDGGQGGNAETKPEDINKLVSTAVAEAMKSLTGDEGVIGKLSKTITTFIDGQSEREKTAKINAVKAQLKDHLKALKATNEACIDDALDTLEYGDNPAFSDMKQSAVAAYEKRYKRYYGDGGKPFGGESSGGGGGDNSYVKSKIEQLKQEAQENANYAKELEKSFV